MRKTIWLLPVLLFSLPTFAVEQATVKAWPLVYHAVDTEAGTERLEIAWPLIDLRTAPEYDGWSLLHLFSRQHNTATDEHRTSGLFDLIGKVTRDDTHWRTWVFPVLWLGRAADSSHAVVFPLYWQFLNASSHTRAVFPLYFGAGNRTGNTHGYLFLVWRGEREYTVGENRHHQTSSTVFPVYWSSQREVNDAVTRQNQTLFPLFSRAEEHDHNRDLDRDEWRHSALFLVRWQSEQKTDKETKRHDRRQQWQVWPLVSLRLHTVDSPADQTARETHETRALGPLVKFGSRETTDAAGTVTQSSYEQRVFPFYFRGGRDYGEKGTYLVLFPCWWDLRKPDSQIQALVPLGARIQDGDTRALNILGPLFTRLKNEEYTRYDALFPFLMVKTGEHTSGFRLWPAYSQYREDGEREGGSVCWPLVRWEERSDARGARTYTPVFGDFAELFSGSSSAEPSGKLTRNVLPFFGSRRTGSGWAWWLFPFGGASHHNDPNRSRESVHAGPFGLFYRHGMVTDADDLAPRTTSSVLAGLWNTEHGTGSRGWRRFWLVANAWHRAYYPSEGLTRETTTATAFPLFHRQVVREREPDAAEIVRESATTTIPLLLRKESEVERDLAAERHGSHLGILPLLGQRGWLYQYDRDADGSGGFSLLDPLWTAQATAEHERNAKSLGGLAYRSERDICGFAERRLFYRVFRTESNSRRSTWELMPFADGMASTRGDHTLQLLGGLFGYETSPERTRLRLAFLPLFTKHHSPQPLGKAELQQRAKQHLAYGLDYLKSRTPERALVELSLAEPGFGDDPALHEKLGDACAQVCTRGFRDDFLEKAAQDIKSFSSDYPSSYQWNLAGRGGPEALFRARAVAAYEKAKALGGDSALLRRKLIGLSLEDSKRAEQYASARQDFPDDFSLRYDDCSQTDFATLVPPAKSQGVTAEAVGPGLKDEAVLAKWRRLAESFPRSARAQHGLLSATTWEMANLPQAVEQALAGAQLPDLPEYQELYPQPDDRSADYPRLCLDFALGKMEALAGHFRSKKQPTEELRWRQRWFETRLDWGLAPSAEWHRRETIGNLRRLHEELKTEHELIPYLERAVADLKPDVEREAWQREIRRLKREASFLTTWEVETAGASRPLQGRLFDRYVNLRTALRTDGEATARCSVTLTSPQARDAVILLGFDESIRLELNGEEAFAGQGRIAVADEFRIPVMLRQGENRLVVEVGNRKLAWGFFLRIADADGNPIDGLVVRAGGR